MTFGKLHLAWAVAMLAAIVPAAARGEDPAEAHKNSDKWVALFDGKTTKGWTPRGEVERFEAADGELQLLSKKNVWVVTDLKLKNFILEAEAKIPDDATGGFNSGLGFRCVGEKGKPRGYQCEIDGGNPGKTGGVYGIGLGGWLYPNKQTAKEYLARAKPAVKHKQWNRYVVHCAGPRIRTYINGQLIADLENDLSLSGYFGIQHHGHGSTMRFRNLRVLDLASEQ